MSVQYHHYTMLELSDALHGELLNQRKTVFVHTKLEVPEIRIEEGISRGRAAVSSLERTETRSFVGRERDEDGDVESDE